MKDLLSDDDLYELWILVGDAIWDVLIDNYSARSLSDNRYKCLIFCGAIMQKKQDWACKTTSQITHS